MSNYIINNRYRSDEIILNHPYGTIFSSYDLINYNHVIMWLMINSPRSKYLFRYYEDFSGIESSLQILDYGTDNKSNQIYLIFKSIELIPFHIYFKNNLFDQYHLLTIYNKIISSLNNLHINKYIHGRLFPTNILFHKEEPFIIGLGLANVFLVKDIPFPENVFLAPEVLSGETPTQESDYFSLSAILFFLLTKIHYQYIDDENDPLKVISDINFQILLPSNRDSNQIIELNEQVKTHLKNGLTSVRHKRTLTSIQF